jgi:hypothetical protein
VGSEVWRGRRNASLARALRSVDVRPLDSALGRAAGELLGAASRSDVIDAAVGLLSKDGDEIVTSDRDDLGVLAAAAGRDIELIRP